MLRKTEDSAEEYNWREGGRGGEERGGEGRGGREGWREGERERERGGGRQEGGRKRIRGRVRVRKGKGGEHTHAHIPKCLHLKVFDVEGLKDVRYALCCPNVTIQSHQQQHDLGIGGPHTSSVL